MCGRTSYSANSVAAAARGLSHEIGGKNDINSSNDVNTDTDQSAPPEAMQFGRALQRILQQIHDANPKLY